MCVSEFLLLPCSRLVSDGLSCSSLVPAVCQTACLVSALFKPYCPTRSEVCKNLHTSDLVDQQGWNKAGHEPTRLEQGWNKACLVQQGYTQELRNAHLVQQGYTQGLTLTARLLQQRCKNNIPPPLAPLGPPLGSFGLGEVFY